MKKAIAAMAVIAALIAAILVFSNRYQTAEDIYIVWQGERVGIKGEGSGGLKWQISQGTLTMTANETVGKQLKLHLSGECLNGHFELTADKRTYILLEGLHLYNPQGPALNFKGSKPTILTLVEGYENSLGDAGIEAGGNLTINGEGSLTINARLTGHKGINIDGDLKIKEEPTLRITTSGKPQTMKRLAPPPSNIGSPLPPPPPGFERYDFSGTAKAIKALGNIIVEGGNITLRTCTPGAEGMESKRDIIINGGIIDVEAYDDAINALMTMTVNGGMVTAASTNNDGIDINGGQLKPWATSPPKGYDSQRAQELVGQPTYFQTGGTVTARTTAGPPEEGLDTDNSPISHTGGELNILDK